TVRVACAGSVTGCVRLIGAPEGGVTWAVSTPCCCLAVVLVTDARRVRSERVTWGGLCWTTWASDVASAAELCGCTGNWRPGLLSGGIGVKSTLSGVNIVLGWLGYRRSASALAR